MAGFNWFRRAFDKSESSEAETKPVEQAQEPAKPEPAPEAAPETQQQLSPEAYLKWAKAAYQNIQKQQTASTPAEETAAPAVAPEEAKPEPETASEAPQPEAAPEEETVISAAAATPETAPVEGVAADAAETEPQETAVAETVTPEAPAQPTKPTPEPVAAEEETPVAEPVPELAASATIPETVVAEEIEAEAPASAAIDAEHPAVEAPEGVETTLVAEAEPTPEPGQPVEPSATAADMSPEATADPEPTPAPAVPFWARADEERQQRLERLKETAILEPEPEPEPTPVASAVQASAAPVFPDIDLDEAFLWSAEVLAAQGRRPDDVSLEEITWLNKLRQGLNKTRLSLVNQLKAIVGQGPLNEEAVLEIEALLLQADVGVEATDKVIEALQDRLREEVLPPDQAIAYLKSILRDMLDAPLGESHNLTFVPEKDTLNIWLMTGVNGAGKTTTIGKLAHIAKKSGYNTLIAAADTFRAAAVEQVKAWGARSDVEVIANPGKNTDPAAVVYDAIAAAQSRQTELLLVDTAGRLQNKKNLMDELSKIRRIVDKNASNAKIESLLVLDATLGQNGLRQAEVFAEAANLSGVVLTKLDGTAKGGIALAVTQQLGLPIRFIGAGEGIEDLRPFSSFEFVEALLSG